MGPAPNLTRRRRQFATHAPALEKIGGWLIAKHDVGAPAVIAGDFNSEPGSFIYRTFTERGWSDVYLAAGNPECDPCSPTWPGTG